MKYFIPALFAPIVFASAAFGQSLWIVTGDDVSQSFSAEFATLSASATPPQGSYSVTSSAEGLSVARIDERIENLLQGVVHDEFHRCGGYTVHPNEASALAELDNPFYDPAYLNRAGLFPGSVDQQASVGPALNLVDPAQIVSTISALQALGTRHYQSQGGEDAATTLKARWDAYAPGRSDYSVDLFSHSWRQSSVIATITGSTDPKELIVIGGHLDSINPANNGNAPGADDDASGVAAVSEALRVILASGFKPQKTLKFIAYAAEEVGLRGSDEIADDFIADPTTDVIAALQFDMTGFSGSTNDMYFITDFVSTDLTNFLRMLISTYNGVGAHQITHSNTACGYACSDHASWTRKGIPAAFPFEALFDEYNTDIHTPNDVLGNLDTTGVKQAKFAKLGVEFAMELAKSDTSAPPSPTPTAKIGFAWANNPTAASYIPSTPYSYNAAGGQITAERTARGTYRVTFEGLGAAQPGGTVQITGYGASKNDCKVIAWGSTAPDFVVRVRCTDPSGRAVDDRYTVLVNWP